MCVNTACCPHLHLKSHLPHADIRAYVFLCFYPSVPFSLIPHHVLLISPSSGPDSTALHAGTLLRSPPYLLVLLHHHSRHPQPVHDPHHHPAFATSSPPMSVSSQVSPQPLVAAGQPLPQCVAILVAIIYVLDISRHA